MGGSVVRRHLEDGDLNRLTPDELAAAALEVLGRRVELSQAALHDALDPDAAVLARTGAGCAAPGPMEAMNVECERELAEAEAWTSKQRRRLRMAEDSLLQAVRERLQGSESM